MEINISDEKINEMLEQSVKNHVQKVMSAFQQTGYQTTAGFDPRMHDIVKSEVTRIIREQMQDVIVSACRAISPEVLAELVVAELRDKMTEMGYN